MTAKRLLLGLSYRLRGPLVWDLLRGPRLKVLVYHGVLGETPSDGITNRYGYNVPSEELERHAEYLARHCNVLPLADAVAGRGLSRTKMNVVLTFDDGYENNYTNGFRILSRFDLPAVYSVSTGFVRRQEPFWNGVVEYAVARSRRADVAISWDGSEHEWSLTELAGRAALYDWLMAECTRVDLERRADLIDRAVRALGLPDAKEEAFRHEDYRTLSAEQVAEMAESGLVELASHSVDHPILTTLEPEAIERQLVESKRDVEEMTGRPCTTFCVPGGKLDDSVVQMAYDAGYELVLTSMPGYGRPGQRMMGRYCMFHHTDPATFADLVHGPLEEVISGTRRFVRALGRRVSI